jgi:hypothetical protein
VVPGGNVIDLLQRLDCASKFAQVDFGQDVGGISVGGIQSGQDGLLSSHAVAHVGGNRVCDEAVVGFGFGTKVGKHCSDDSDSDSDSDVGLAFQKQIQFFF